MGSQSDLIRHRNERVRQALAHDLQELQGQLSPKYQARRVAHNTVDSIKGMVGMDTHTTNGSSESVPKSSKLGLATLGLGAFLVANGMRKRSAKSTTATYEVHGHTGATSPAGPNMGPSEPGVKDKVGQRAGDVADKAKDKAEDAKMRLTETREQASEKLDDAKFAASMKADELRDSVGHARDVVVERVPTSRTELDEFVHENMAVLGVLALAAGAAIGALVPHTRLERERLSDLQDDVTETVQERVGETIDKTKEALKTGVEAAQEELGSDDEDSGVTTPNRITGADSRSAAGDSLYTG